MLSSCNQSPYALRTLRSYGLPDPLLQIVFQSKVLSKITYCSPAWCGFANAAEIDKIDAFLRRTKKFQFCSNDIEAVEDIFDRVDDNFLKNVTSDKSHV